MHTQKVDEAFGRIETYVDERLDMLTKVISTAKEESKREMISTLIQFGNNPSSSYYLTVPTFYL